MDRVLLAASTFCFLSGFAFTIFTLAAGRYRPSRFHFSALSLGFILQTAFLCWRGHALRRCPLTSLFEVFIFLSWSMVLFYLLIGPAYRLSLLGVFTAPLVFVFQTFALLALPDHPRFDLLAPNPWLELHAAISIVAYGAFALGGVAGAMLLVQERQLKTHHLHPFFFQLPPLHDLAVAIRRLLLTGFLLLTIGLLAGFQVRIDWWKVGWGAGVWLIYGAILQAEKWQRISPRRIAQLSVAAFSLTLTTLWGLNFLSPPSH